MTKLEIETKLTKAKRLVAHADTDFDKQYYRGMVAVYEHLLGLKTEIEILY
jgi:predicted outer membrane protein